MRSASAGGADDGEVVSRATATATAEEDGDDGDDAVLVEAALVDLFAVRTELTAKPLGGRRDTSTLTAEEASSATAMNGMTTMTTMIQASKCNRCALAAARDWVVQGCTD